MLYLAFDNYQPNEIDNLRIYVDMLAPEEWFLTDEVKQIVKDIEKNECYGKYNIKNSVWGSVGVNKLSNGVKILICALFYDQPIDGSKVGDNCAEWLLKIAEKKDVYVNMYHYIPFERDFDAICLDDNSEIHNLTDYFRCFLKFF